MTSKQAPRFLPPGEAVSDAPAQTTPAASDGAGGFLRVVLPLPPTVNKLWVPVATRRGARMVKRTASQDWADGAMRLVASQAPTRIDGGRIKPLLDALQAGGAIRNDKYCRSLHVEIDDSREGTALIELTALLEIPPSQRQPARKKGAAGKEQTP